jgi:hypothetical protein
VGLVTRVWLSATEWACCGDPFVVGDTVEFLIGSRSVPPLFARQLGSECAATIDALEERHPQTPTDDVVRGRVRDVYTVAQQHVERFTLRRPGHGAPADAQMPAEGELWPLAGRDLGNGLFIGSRPTRWMVTSEALPGAVTLTPCVRVPEVRDDSAPAVGSDELDGSEPAERTVVAQIGWLVDVDEQTPLTTAPVSTAAPQARDGRSGLRRA